MRPVVVLDACVLYPAAQRDFFMWLAAGGAIRAHWTNEIHEEWMRNVERDYRVARSVLEHVRRLMDRAAGDALIGRYRQHESLFAKTDAKDRHVAAAAVAARKRAEADIVKIITWNIGDFDRKELAKVGVVAETPDAFLCRLIAGMSSESGRRKNITTITTAAGHASAPIMVARNVRISMPHCRIPDGSRGAHAEFAAPD
jgi:hypothetical protein